jgi:hypothetical protein
MCASPPSDGGTVADDHYDCEVNRGDLSMMWLKKALNDRWNDGWRLSHTFVQHDNTVLVYERRS